MERTEREPTEGKELYSVAVGNADPFNSASRRALKFIRKLDGLVGVTPMYPRGTLIYFESLNSAKVARNRMNSVGIQTGNNICKFVYRNGTSEFVGPC